MQTIEFDHLQLAYRDQGDGPPVLMIHGFPLDHSMWEPLIDQLAADHRVIVPDLRGFGRSQVTEGIVTMEQYADDLSGLLDALKVTDKIVLAGLSMGGYVAWEFWRKYARRLAGLILCDTRAEPDPPLAAQTRLQTADRVMEQGTTFLADMMLEKLFSAATRREDPNIVQEVRQVMLSAPRAGVAAASRGMAQRIDARPLLEQIHVPALLLAGREDIISPVKEMQAIAAEMPNAWFVEIQNAGHMAPLEQPETVGRAIREFLGTLA